jgi:alanine racemase
MRTACAAIDLDALRHNYGQVRRWAPHSRIMCVIKAHAYGHGLLEVARALPQADGFAVACIDEALLLRQSGIQQPLTVFQGFQSAEDLRECEQHNLWPVVHQQQQLEILARGKPRNPLAVWLKVATGINRLGFRPEEIASVWQRLQGTTGIGPIRLMTHMARADEGPSATDPTLAQISLFDSTVQNLDGEHSLANSATLVGWPDAQRDWVRPGIMLYGAEPFLAGRGPQLDLQPVMTLTSRLIAINQRKRGEPVGYGGGWQCPADMPVGVVAIGYGDGYPRHIDATTPVLVRGRRAAIIGRVSMDLLMVNLSGMDAAVGDEVVLWGKGLPVDEIARHADTIGYELLCNIYGRVRCDYQGQN